MKSKDNPMIDSMADFIETTLEAEKPALLLTVFGIGTTTKIEDYCKRHGYPCLLIDEYEAERSLVGIPCDPSASSINWEKLLKEALFAPEKVSGLADAFKLYAPTDIIVDEVEKYSANQTPFVLVVEGIWGKEPLSWGIQAAIYRILFENVLVRTQLSQGQMKFIFVEKLNPYVSNEGEILDLFPEKMMARFSCFRKTSYELYDAELALVYMKTNNYFKPLVDFLEQQGPAWLLEMMKYWPPNSLTENSSSLRSIHSLSDFLNHNMEKKSVTGTVLCANKKLLEDFEASGEVSYDTAFAMMNEIKKHLKNWAARVLGAEYAGQGKDSLEKAINVFETKIIPAMMDPEMEKCYQDDGSNAQKVFGVAVKTMRNFLAIDDLVKKNRERLFAYYVSNAVAKEFALFYNNISSDK